MIHVVFFSLALAPLALFGEEEENPSYGGLGDAAFEAGRFDEAVDLYTKRLDEISNGTGDSGRAAVLSKRGRAYLSLARYGEALSDLDRAVALAPGLVDAYYYRALARLDIGRYADAERDAESAVKIDPNVCEYYILLGELKNIDGDYKGALDDFDRALKLNRESPAAYCGRGFAFLGFEQYEFAMRDFRRAAKLDTNFAPAYRGMALVTLSDDTADAGTALGYAVRGVRIERSHSNLDTLAAANYRAGNLYSAAEAQGEAVELLSDRGTPGEKIRFEADYKERFKLYKEASAAGGE